MRGVATAARAIAAELERVQKERQRLQEHVAELHHEIAELELRAAALEQAGDALRGTGLDVEPSRRRSARRAIDIVVEAIGKFGLDPWTSRQLVVATGLAQPTVSPILSRLLAEGRIRRTARGEYRTLIAKVVAS